MSHKATNWLSSLPAEALGNSEFRVLFHLCDCHNPSRGCFPTQEYLKEATGVSNGTLNNALNGLEAKKLIARHRSFDNKTRRQRPTRYLLGFELPKEGEPSPEFGDGPGGDPTPETGDGTGQKPSPKTGDGAVSNLGGEPSPTFGASRLQPAGEEPVKEPVKNHAMGQRFCEKTRKAARFWAERISENGFVSPNAISDEVAACMVAEKLIEATRIADIRGQGAR